MTTLSNSLLRLQTLRLTQFVKRSLCHLSCSIGPEGNLLRNKEENAHRLVVDHPILTNEEMAALNQCNHRGWTSKTIDITYETNGNHNLSDMLDSICEQSTQAIKDGHSLVILSDRNLNSDRNAVSCSPGIFSSSQTFSSQPYANSSRHHS